MLKGNNKIETVAGRITVFNGKFRTRKGEKDATFRPGRNIPQGTPYNFSAGYTGHAIHMLSQEHLEGEK